MKNIPLEAAFHQHPPDTFTAQRSTGSNIDGMAPQAGRAEGREELKQHAWSRALYLSLTLLSAGLVSLTDTIALLQLEWGRMRTDKNEKAPSNQVVNSPKGHLGTPRLGRHSSSLSKKCLEIAILCGTEKWCRATD